jgi:hypothetical protein
MHHSRRTAKTRIVYGGTAITEAQRESLRHVEPPTETPYHLYWGEIHGHTELSDGVGTVDAYLCTARDVAGLDFGAVTDHDHGGVAKPELWGHKWEQIQEKVAQYHAPGEFVTLLGYERDSWPWYANLCIYYRDGQGELIRGEEDGEITREELVALLARDDVLAIPHHTATMVQGANFDAIPLELMTPLMEVYSKWGTSEYWGNPEPVAIEARGGHWRVALEAGARMGCVAGSDVHSPHPGLVHHVGHDPLRYDHPGLCAVLAEELSREAIFDALKARRCYGASGARIVLDLRLNEAVMGQEMVLPADVPRRIWIDVQGEAPLARVDLVKNGQDHITHHTDGQSASVHLALDDLYAERETDYYYLRATQSDGRRAWSSPIWVTTE